MKSRSDALRELEREVAAMMRRIRRVIAERAQAVHPELQSSTYLMLAHLLEEGPRRASELSSAFDIDKGAISRQVQNLVDLGLVARTPDPDDGRATLLTVTDEGARRFNDVVAHRRKQFAERLGDWSAEELLAFAATLGRYNEALDS